MRAGRILVVDDDPSSASYMSLALEQAGHSVRTASGGFEALLAMERELPELVVSDFQMPTMDGLELLSRIKERWPRVPVVLVTVEDEVATIVEAVSRGAVNYLVKPVAPSVLQLAVGKAVSRAAATGGAVESSEAHEIVGTSPAMVHVRHLVALASRSDVNVLVTGETGTGKELIARAVHRLSSLARGPFIAHNCALVPPDLFESEFFGHLRGAFTGADRQRAGILREADGGVLFLDELECLSLAHQAKLLRVLDDGEVRPVGSEESRPVAVRFLAATNRAPSAMIEKGELREDLYYRLRGFEITLPPLRDRPSDILLLAEHFLNKERGQRLTDRAADALERCSWPGNVRQLRNVLRAACAGAPGGVIDEHHLDLVAAGGARAARATLAPDPPSSVERFTKASLEAIERDAILQALAAHQGNRSRAAEALGIHRSTLRRKLRELNLKPER
jgi:DNA-binding NtrC family response regulator